MKLIRNKLYPELSLFEDSEDRERAWRAAQYALTRNPKHRIITRGFVAGYCVLTLSLLFLGIPMLYVPWGLGLLLVAATYSLYGFFRRGVRRELRTTLAKRGVPICIPCGYNLTGNISGVCSECGTQMKDQS